MAALALGVMAAENDLPDEFTDANRHHLEFDIDLRK